MPKQQNAGCCHDRKGDEVLARFQARIEALGLEQEVHVKASGCLSNCALGVSIKVFPGPYMYGEVLDDDIEEIIGQHLVLGQPIDRMLIPVRNFPGL